MVYLISMDDYDFMMSDSNKVSGSDILRYNVDVDGPFMIWRQLNCEWKSDGQAHQPLGFVAEIYFVGGEYDESLGEP